MNSSRTPRAFLALLAFAVVGLPLLAGCNPVYVARAGWAQARLLAAREPLVERMVDPATDPVTRGKLRLVHDARGFAIHELGFRNAGDSYTSVTTLESDTLALVLSAAYRDRLAFRTWWFPIAGRVPYRAYFDTESAERARAELDAEGFDTWLRPTAAFSTLGWFADPLHSTILRRDEVGVVETVLHELAHNHRYIPGQGRFNESWATFAGYAAAIEFFCRRAGGGPDTLKCQRAHDRWSDARRVSGWLMALEEDIRAIYADRDRPVDARIDATRTRYHDARDHFRDQVRPSLLGGGFAIFADEPMNNATLLARTLYYHRLEDFHTLWQAHSGDLRAVLELVRGDAVDPSDPFSILDAPTLDAG